MEFSTQRSFTAPGSYWVLFLFFYITTLTTPSINGYGDLQWYMTPGASNYFWSILFLGRWIWNIGRQLAKGTIGLFIFVLFWSISDCAQHVDILGVVDARRGSPFYLPASWLNCDLWTMECSFSFFILLFLFLIFFGHFSLVFSAGRDELDGYCILYLRNTLVL
ncbi:hypothetical protein J3F84DRAFT_22148 [Trichoderma pleuroticola]